MDVRSMIRQRLEELGIEQRELAVGARVTESYVSQLLTRKKLPPAPDRTDIYVKMEKTLQLPQGSLSELAEHERREALKRQMSAPLPPLLEELRELVVRKCEASRRPEMLAIFEREPFGELEHLITQKLLDLVKRVVKEDLENENWLRLVARLSGRTYEELRVIGLEFLDTDLFHVSVGDCVAFLDPLLESWAMDLSSFSLEVVLNRRLVPDHVRRYEFVEREQLPEEPAGLREFLADPALSAGATGEEIALLRGLRLGQRSPTALYYYRELQSLRDPLHFRRPVRPRQPRRKRSTGR